MSEKLSRRRSQASSASITVSIALVLFMLGLLSFLLLKTKSLSDYFKENIIITVYLKDEAKEVDIAALQKSIDSTRYHKTTEFISKDRALLKLQQEIGQQDLIKGLDGNPLPNSIEVSLKADYADSAHMKAIARDLKQAFPTIVDQVDYPQDLVAKLNTNMRTWSIGLLIFSGLLLLVAVGLINNTIRLAIYSKRFLIRTMQLVGATQGFIRRPFIWTGLRNGIVGALFSLLLVGGVIGITDRYLPELKLVQSTDISILAVLCGMQVLLGMFITWFSTWLAVRKYLRQDLDALYSR